MSRPAQLALVVFLLVGSRASAQLPSRLEKCLPYPTIAQEIRDVQPKPRTIHLRVAKVEFDASDATSSDLRQQIAAAVQNHPFEAKSDTDYTKEIASEIAEVFVRGSLQNRGYFRVSTDAKLVLLKVQGDDVTATAKLSAVPGLQYRLGDLTIQSALDGESLKISPAVLRSLIPLIRGDLFDVERLRTGLKNMTRAYGQLGYIDMTAEPDFEFHDANNTIDVTLRIDEQAPYRLGTVEFLGVNASTQEKLRKSLPRPGDIFDSTSLERFFAENRAILPADASRDEVTINRDVKTRSVNVSIDLRSCGNSSTSPA